MVDSLVVDARPMDAQVYEDIGKLQSLISVVCVNVDVCLIQKFWQLNKVILNDIWVI